MHTPTKLQLDNLAKLKAVMETSRRRLYESINFPLIKQSEFENETDQLHAQLAAEAAFNEYQSALYDLCVQCGGSVVISKELYRLKTL